jgi:hypothetical protein
VSREDDRLLALLTQALEPEPLAPSPERVTVVRARAEAGARLLPLVQRHRRRWRTLVSVAVAAVLAAFGTGLVLGHDLPRPVRDLAHDLGLPVESVELVDTRAAVDRLGSALSQEDPEEVAFADAEMVRLVNTLEEKERAKIEPVAHEVHLRAVEFLEQNPAET